MKKCEGYNPITRLESGHDMLVCRGYQHSHVLPGQSLPQKIILRETLLSLCPDPKTLSWTLARERVHAVPTKDSAPLKLRCVKDYLHLFITLKDVTAPHKTLLRSPLDQHSPYNSSFRYI